MKPWMRFLLWAVVGGSSGGAETMLIPVLLLFFGLVDALAANGNPHWGGTEANPRGLGQRGMAMEAYLKRHFDYGATLVVMNVGATSEALMRRLHDAVWGQEALEAYRSFLKSR